MIYVINTRTKEHREVSEDLLAVGIPESQYWSIIHADADGWIPWNDGGDCPLPDGAMTAYKLRSGNTYTRPECVDFLDWDHKDTDPDIIAYRPILDADDERGTSEADNSPSIGLFDNANDLIAELNADGEPEVGSDRCPACGGNDLDMPCAYPSENAHGCLRDKRRNEQDEWNGEGLPPVGCVFEALVDDEWRPMRCVAVDCGAVFAWDTGEPVGIDSAFVKMRPIRSAEDRAVEEIVEVIVSHYEYPKGAEQYMSLARKLYRAGYRKTK